MQIRMAFQVEYLPDLIVAACFSLEKHAVPTTKGGSWFTCEWMPEKERYVRSVAKKGETVCVAAFLKICSKIAKGAPLIFRGLPF